MSIIERLLQRRNQGEEKPASPDPAGKLSLEEIARLSPDDQIRNGAANDLRAEGIDPRERKDLLQQRCSEIKNSWLNS